LASLQAYPSHERRYYRIVESFRQNGKPRLRVLVHLGRAEDVLRRVEGSHPPLQVASISAGAVTAPYELARELDVAGHIDGALEQDGHRVQKRGGLTAGESLLAGLIGRACAPGRKRAFADWAAQTYLPALMGFAPRDLTSEHFWEQMDVLPEKLLGSIEQALVRLLWWRARRRTGFAGGPHRLLSELSPIRCCHVTEKTGRAGRPRVHGQLEESDETLRELGELPRALPRLAQDVVYTP
jgi:hypothetical protein